MRCDPPIGISKDATARSGLVFLAQRLEELTSPRSLDSYKAYTVNVPTLIAEAIEQLEAIRDAGPGISLSSADAIVAELIERAKGNQVCSAMIRSERELIKRLKGGNSESLLATLKMLKQELAGWAFATKAMSLLIDSIEAGKKSQISSLSSELVTTLVNLGMSRRHINEAVVAKFWVENATINGPDDLKSFFRDIFPHYHDFKVYMVVKNPLSLPKAENSSSLNITFSDKLPKRFSDLPEYAESKIEGKSIALASGIKAYDCHSAVQSAFKKLNLLQNIYRMFNHDFNLGIEDRVFVEQCCADGFRSVVPETYSKRPVSDMSRPVASERLRALVSSSRFLVGKHYDKFVSVSEFHGHSLEASSIENRLLNLWISLETIVPSRRGKSKIDSVVLGSASVLGITYIKRIFSALSHDLMIWDRVKSRTAVENVSESNVFNRKLLYLCVSSKYKDDLVNFLSELEGQELLRNRIYTIQKMFSSSDSSMTAIESHSQRVDWQLRRIYRARNQIVHLGRTPSFVSSLVDSAHDYVDQLMSTIANVSLGPNGFTDFDASFEYLDWEFDTYRDSLSSIDFADPKSVDTMIWQKVEAVSRYEVIEKPKRKAVSTSLEAGDRFTKPKMIH